MPDDLVDHKFQARRECAAIANKHGFTLDELFGNRVSLGTDPLDLGEEGDSTYGIYKIEYHDNVHPDINKSTVVVAESGTAAIRFLGLDTEKIGITFQRIGNMSRDYPRSIPGIV